MSFTSLGISEDLVKLINKENIVRPYPIQQKAIPAILNKKDVLGIAKTGSGKTASYVLPILTNLQNSSSSKNRYINTLVLVPTRELAVQVEKVFKIFSSNTVNAKSIAVYGGVSINPQMIGLQGVNILIATPGRLLELVEKNAVHLSEIATLVVDEADKLLNMGFADEINRIFSLLPKKRQNLLFSATLSDDVSNIKQILLNNPLVVKIEDKKDNIELINQKGYFVTESRKGPLLRYIIKTNNLNQVLVFTSSTYKADIVAEKLRKNGIEALAIHGKKSQNTRTTVLDEFKKGELRVLVTTDLLSRGIDIEFLPHVINYELPRSPKDFIHRIGRTGRAENPGEAISLITPDDKHHFKVIQKKMGKWITMINSDDFDLQGY
ncbi:MAG: DEAD/DEAH box helicase [Bacteroidota bacterium]|nr:DEAD/DEAH box helicase [Bacteroidota bacterium]